MKKILNMVLIFGIIILSVQSVSITSKAYAAHSQSEAVNWANSQINKGLDYDGIYGNQCVDLIKYYYDYLGVAGYATGNANAYASNTLPPGWTRVYGDYQPGDIAVWKTNHSCSTCNTGPLGHVGIIESADSVGFNAINQNFNEAVDGAGVCKKVWFYCSALECAIRPDFTSDTSAPTISNISITDVTKDGYTVTCTVNDNVGVTSVKFPSWNTDLHQGEDANWLVGTVSGNVASCRIETSSLKSGSIEGNYTTHIYAYDAAGNQSFSRTEIVYIDRTAPVIEWARIIQADYKGYSVEIKATDNKKVNRVQCPTWSIKNGQDDLIDEWWINSATKATNKGNDIYEFRVNVSAHNNEYGKYRTHIYAYDDCGNEVRYNLLEDVVVDSITTDADGWTYCHVLPEEVNVNEYLIEYNNYFEKIQKDSPGADWVKAETVKNEWQNSGGQYTSETDLPTSDARVLLRSVYYHFCGPNAGNSSNYEQIGNFVHYDEIDVAVYGVIPYYQGLDEGHPYYMLDWNDGGGRVYCQSGVTCDGSYGTHGTRNCTWYKMNTYQDRVKVEEYKYTKYSGWVTSKDNSAKSVEIRFKRINNQVEPLPEEPTIEKPAPEVPSPEEPTPENPTTEKPTPEEPTPEEPTSEDPIQENPDSELIMIEFEDDGTEYKVTGDNTLEFVEYQGSESNIVIPDVIEVNDVSYKVTSITDNAFTDNRNIKNIIIGNNVKTIGKNAFSGCVNLETVILGKNVTTIGSKAFYNCKSLTKITIPSKVTKIDDYAFKNCKKLTSVTIGKAVKTIGKEAFKGCSKLKSINIKSKNLKTVGKNTFKGIKSNAKIKVPSSKLKNYKKLLKNKGQGKGVKITK